MGHDEFEPRTAVREEKRQAYEALGRSFCKTLAELITNSDSSAKRMHNLPHAGGLVDLMLQVEKGTELDTSALKAQLRDKTKTRTITIEVVTAQGHGRARREIAVIDQAQGMSVSDLETALRDPGGDRADLAEGSLGRNLFGRGLSDVIKAHNNSEIQTFDGVQLSIASGSWSGKLGRWKISRHWWDTPKAKDFKALLLQPGRPGTAVKFVGATRGFSIPDPDYIVSRLANYYMLRLIAADPNVELILRQFRAGRRELPPEGVVYDFPVGQIIERSSRKFDFGNGYDPVVVDFLVARSDRKLQGQEAGEDRQNGLLIVDELDAVYDLTFVDRDYEKADFVQQLYGIVRINGLRAILESYLNDQKYPTSPLRVDREGFKADHEFTKALFGFVSKELKPCFERERKRLEDREQDKLSRETQKRIDDALKHLNKYFQKITEKTGPGEGGEDEVLEPPEASVAFLPESTRIIVGQPRRVHLLVRDDVVSDGAELVATASEGFTVQPDIETIYRKKTSRWQPHPNFFCIPFLVTGANLGQSGTVTALVDCVDDEPIEASLQIVDVLEEPTIVPPANMEFRPSTAMGRPNRRNSLTLYVNPAVISVGHHVRFRIVNKMGAVELLDPGGEGCQELTVKLNPKQHGVRGQDVLRVRIPWRGTAWNQHAVVEARVKIGSSPLTVEGRVRLDESEVNDAGFFKKVDYGDVDGLRPSLYAAGVIKLNMHDPLNKLIYGQADTEVEARKLFDRRVLESSAAQQRLVGVLVEEASFRALEELRTDNKLHLPDGGEVTALHSQIDEYKFSSAAEIHKALAKRS